MDVFGKTPVERDVRFKQPGEVLFRDRFDQFYSNFQFADFFHVRVREPLGGFQVFPNGLFARLQRRPKSRQGFRRGQVVSEERVVIPVRGNEGVEFFVVVFRPEYCRDVEFSRQFGDLPVDFYDVWGVIFRDAEAFGDFSVSRLVYRANEEILYRGSSEDDFRIPGTFGNRKRLELDFRSAFEFEAPFLREIRDGRVDERLFLIEGDFRHDGAFASLDRDEFRVLGKVEHPFFRNGRSLFRIEKGLRYLDALFRIGDFHFSEFFETVFQRYAADVLYFESGAGVDFEKLRTVGRYHPVEREIAEIGEKLYFGRMEENGVPMWNFSLLVRCVALGESRGIITPVDETARHLSASDVESEAHSALREVGFAIRSVSRHANHRGHGHEIENDDPDVGESVFAERRKRIRRHEGFFDQHRIGSGRYRIFPLENVREAALEFVAFVFGSRCLEFRGFTSDFSYDHDAPSLASSIRFHDEFFWKRVKIEMSELVLVPNAPVRLRNGNSTLRQKSLGTVLVVGQADSLTGIEFLNVVEVSRVDAEKSEIEHA